MQRESDITASHPAATIFPARALRRSLWADHLATLIFGAVPLVILGLLLWLIGDVLVRGIREVSLSFLVSAPLDAGRAGGIGPIIVSTLAILAVTLATAMPLALATAILLSQRQLDSSAAVRLVRRSLDALAAVPSIVFGLFGNALFCIALGLGYSILSGGLTLACMVLPILIRLCEQALRAAADEHEMTATALGLSRTSVLLRVQLPVAAPAMAAGLVIGIGRALAETAALLFTAGYVTRMPASPLDSGRAMSVHIYDLAMNVPAGNDRAYATAAALLLTLLVINAAAWTLSSFAARHVHYTAGAN